jgi:hypothetical protein
LAPWKLTVQHGSDVSSEAFRDLDAAVAALRERALAIRSEGPVETVSGLRDYGPGDQVHARLQLSRGGLLHRAVAGVDLRGNGELVPYRGGVRREELEPGRGETPFELIREALAR